MTGGASGIGLALGQALAAAGARVALADLDGEALTEAAAATDGEVATYVLDVRDREAFAEVADKAEAQLGPVSLLFNNAGIASPTRIPELRYELWDCILDIDLGGVVNGTQTFLPRMLERDLGGHVVNTASTAGLVVGPGVGYLYHTAKYAVVGLSEALSVELQPFDIGVSVLCPGAVATNILDNTERIQAAAAGPREMTPETQARSDFGRTILAQGTPPADVAQMVLDAIRRRQLFIHTDPHAANAIRERTAEILAAVPGA